ncbi:methyltransferase-like protein 22 isoform X2 [Pomacea canaliculata]|uniref:methyltransferase-like protein 22 isoform X2 n=1 Tax=Pomacea canaliculata TaxID=400727 RepID=UPI000D733219|nr:methyltransferase-like protein 22 isoform X2 [Pomacea canaliculata]
MESDDDDDNERQFLSEVHMASLAEDLGVNRRVSRFFFQIPKALRPNIDCDGGSVVEDQKRGILQDAVPSKEIQEILQGSSYNGEACKYDDDEDGDPVISRQSIQQQKRDNSNTYDAVITLEHAMTTPLKDVGHQVWLGALLLCDFMLYAWQSFHEAIVLDLGAGVGLTSIVAAYIAQTVFCTDKGDPLLKLAQRNVERNTDTLPVKGEVRVRELDWNTQAFPSPEYNQRQTRSEFPFRAQDLQVLENCSVILAAEVVYDVELTDVFFRFLYSILIRPPAKTAYLTVEKRQVFSIADLDIVSPAYEQFRENLADLASVDQGPVRFVCTQVDTNFPQFFQYQRVKELG